MGGYAIVQGSLNIDLVMRGRRLPRRGESVFGDSFDSFPGGKGANQAMQLARLGFETFMIGRVGSDVYGDQLIESLQAAGVRTDYVARDGDHGTGKGWVFIDDSDDNYIIVIPEANMQWQAADLAPMLELCAGADLSHPSRSDDRDHRARATTVAEARRSVWERETSQRLTPCSAALERAEPWSSISGRPSSSRTTSMSAIRIPPRPQPRDFRAASLAAKRAARRAAGSAARCA